MTQALPYTIVNVDDNDVARYAKRQILERAGYRVMEASTAADGLRLVSKINPQLVLLGVKLPDMSGLDVCRIIKTEPSTCDVLVLQISASPITP